MCQTRTLAAPEAAATAPLLVNGELRGYKHVGGFHEDGWRMDLIASWRSKAVHVTGNRLLLHLMQAIRERLTEMFGTVFKFPGGPERSIAQHRLITQAIAAEDAERARQAMTEHILRVEQELAQLDR